jgi:hypothetical protein
MVMLSLQKPRFRGSLIREIGRRKKCFAARQAQQVDGA